MRIVLAPDKFKGSCSAATVAEQLTRGLHSVAPDLELCVVPIADGGDGMVDAVVACGFTEVEVEVADALGRRHRANYAWRSSDKVAVVEMASLCGLAMLGDELDPLGASSAGLGEAIAAAIAGGAEQVIVGIGGSASTDGGAGMLVALGARLFDADGQPVPPNGGHLSDVARLDLSGLLPALAQTTLLIACDVDNPLTGDAGAAAIYGPQKGADPAQVAALDAALTRWADLVAAHTGSARSAADQRDTPGAGAAGGVGFAALAVLGATLRPGADLVMDLTGLDDALAGADLVITGEGSLDEQTLNGKAPAAVAHRAASRGITVWAVAGRTTLRAQTLRAAGIGRVWTLAERVEVSQDSFDRAAELLAQIGADIATELVAANPGGQARYDTVFRARRAVVDGAMRAVEVGVLGGRIAVIAELGANLVGAERVDLADDEVLLPGLVDSHVHVNEPGRTEWEGFDTATAAAAAGGVTTIIDMPLNSLPSTVTVEALQKKREVARSQARVDVGFWGGAVPDHLDDLEALHAAGVFGFKCFLADSGVAEFPPLNPRQFATAMTTTAALGALLIVHAEDEDVLSAAPAASGTTYASFLASRPPDAEDRAIALVIDTARRTGGAAHILHLSSAHALAEIHAARADGVDLSVETCPHYLTLRAEEIPAGATQFKCCPPIRDSANQSALWAGLAGGDIDLVVSDHSPCTPELKRFDSGDFGEAWGGIASLQVGLAALWSAARERGHTLDDVVGWMATAPADRVGLTHKGRIAPDADADLVVFAPDADWHVDVGDLRHKNPVSAYHGRDLTGVVRQTWLRGIRIDQDSQPVGQLIERGQR